METITRQRVPKKNGRRYPWAEWFGMGSFTLTRGVHYATRSDVMAQQIRNAARRPRWRLRVSIHIADDSKSLTVISSRQRRPGPGGRGATG